jgi:hypothetical protein
MRSHTFTHHIAPHVRAEIALASRAHHIGRPEQEFAHLEAAHVLGQESTWWHVRTHMLMARWAWRHHDTRELFGQALRIIGAATKTFIGMVPRGNTGGSRISPFKVLPLSPAHASLITQAKEASKKR